jgi:hypothetical protein
MNSSRGMPCTNARLEANQCRTTRCPVALQVAEMDVGCRRLSCSLENWQQQAAVGYKLEKRLKDVRKSRYSELAPRRNF